MDFILDNINIQAGADPDHGESGLSHGQIFPLNLLS